MEIKVIHGDCLKVDLFSGVTHPGGATGAADRALSGIITDLIESGEITGKLHATTVVHTYGKIPARRVAVTGLGSAAEFDCQKIKGVTAAALRAARARKARTVATIVHGAGIGGLAAEPAAAAIAEAALLVEHECTGYRAPDPDCSPLTTLYIVEADAAKVEAIRRGVVRGRILAEATNLARELVNAPGNAMTPTILASKAVEMAAGRPLTCEVMGRPEMKELGMGALLGVAQGSAEEPRLIVLKYLPRPEDPEILAFAGKGLTFDSGGISIKPADGMQEMKDDMAGGAAVIGAMAAIADLGLPVNIIGLIGATENMPGGKAQKPGDVVRASNGKTIEIVNTDAEGRLVLADVVAYAVKLGATRIVDIATLTGSVVVALGKTVSGYITNNAALGSDLARAAAAAGEQVWQMPIFPEYKEANRSEIADIKNSGGRPAGMITSGLFIGEFAGDKPWLHLDIAGTAWTDKELPYLGKGATGVAVRTLVHLAEGPQPE